MAIPPPNQNPIKPDEIIGILLRYRWVVMIPLCLTLTVGLYLALTIPRVYSTTTTILVVGQKVPGSYVKSIVTASIDDRINTISQQILSQSNLEKIIHRFGLFTEKEFQKWFLEDKIKNLRKRIHVNLTRTRKGPDAFSITYEGTRPERVMNITNTLADLYMDENLKLRESQAVGTSQFLDSELKKTREKLAKKEHILSEYRSKYMGGLPEELQSNLKTLDRLQQQLTDRQTILQETRNNIANLKAQMNQVQESKSQARGAARQLGITSEDTQPLAPDTATRLAQAKLELEELLMRYTDKHPDVIKKRAAIARLERLEKTEEHPDLGKIKDKTGGKDLATVTGTNIKQTHQLNQLRNQEAQVQEEIADIKKQMNLYQRRVDKTPRREQELKALERDYSNIQQIYNSLMDRKLEAELSVNMEKKQKGEQFRILDPAMLPKRPISPNMQKLFVFSTAAGVGIGGGIIFLMVFFDDTVRRNEDIEKDLGLPILASVTPLEKRQDRSRNRLELIGFILMTGYVLFLLAAFAFINIQGVDQIMGYLAAF